METPCFSIPTSTTVIQPEQPIVSTVNESTPCAEYSIPTQIWLADQLTKLSPARLAPFDDLLEPIEVPTKTKVPFLQDEELKARVIQEAVQAEKDRRDSMMLKARGRFAQLVHESATEGRPKSAIFLAPERAATQYSKLTINEPVNNSELHRPPSIDYVKSRTVSSKLDKHISEYPEYKEAMTNQRQQRKTSRKAASPSWRSVRAKSPESIDGILAKTAPHLLDNKRFKPQYHLVETYVDNLSTTPLQNYKSIGTKDTRPSSCFLSSERDKYVPSLAYRQNKTESELKAPRLMAEKASDPKRARCTVRCSSANVEARERQNEDSNGLNLVPSEHARKSSRERTSARETLDNRDFCVEHSAPDRLIRETDKTKPSKEQVTRALGTRSIASRSVTNHTYKRNERSVSPWKDWRIKNSLSVRQPEVVTDLLVTDDKGNDPQKQKDSLMAIARQKGKVDERLRDQGVKAKRNMSGAQESLPNDPASVDAQYETKDIDAKAIKVKLDEKYGQKRFRNNVSMENSRIDIIKENTNAIQGTQPIDRRLVAQLRQEHVRKLGAGRNSSELRYSPNRRAQSIIAKAKQSAFCLEDEESSTVYADGNARSPSSRRGASLPPDEPHRISGCSSTTARLTNRIPVHDRIKYKTSAYIPDYSKTSGRDQSPGHRHLCNVSPMEAPQSAPARARGTSCGKRGAPTSPRYHDMQGLLYTPAGLPVPKSLVSMLSDNILGNIKEIPASTITADVEGAQTFLVAREHTDYTGVRRFSAQRPISVNDLHSSPGRNHVPMSQQSPRSRPITQSGMRYDSKRAAEPFQPVVDNFDFMPNAEATIEEANLERKRYNMTHPTLTLASKMPKTGREVVPGKMAAYTLTNLNVPMSTMITKANETQAGAELHRPIISTSHFDYIEQLDVRSAGAYVKPRVKVPRIMPNKFEGSNMEASRLGLDLKIGLLDDEYMQGSKFYDKTHIDDCFKSVASSPCFSLQTTRPEFVKKGHDITYKVNYSAVEPRIATSPSMARQRRRFK